MYIFPHLFFRTYSPSGHTCGFPSSPFPHVQFLRSYVRFLPHPPFRMYNSCGHTCGFSLIPLSACTVSVVVHALSPSPPFPHVQFLQVYMRFCPPPLFRMYNSCRCTCTFSLTSFSACTIPAVVHAVLPSSTFPHVQILRSYMHFLPHPLFRMYRFCGRTCTFSLIHFSACTIPAGVPALSPSFSFLHV